MWPFSSSSWKLIAEQKRDERDQAIARTKKVLGAESDADAIYLKATASEITKRIEAGEWTATQVLEAFIRRAIRAQETTNCLTEVMFDQALKEAAALDAEFSSTRRLRGPLHGVPVSFKDQFDIVGLDAAIGYTQWANKPSTTDAQLVKQFRAAGAVIITKTNVPQTMLSFECSNPIWGRTTNPWSDKHTAGGSSGGEAALLTMSGSVIGVGTDVGGSLRIPTAYCGIYSLKTGFGRLSYAGARTPTPGMESIHTVAGPMARSVDDVELMCRTCFGAPGLNCEEIPPVPYREFTLPSKLRFGYYTSDNFIKASPACQRAVIETVEALRKAGHECIEIKTNMTREALVLFAGLVSADGYQTLLSHLGPDPKENSLFMTTLGPRLFGPVRNLGAWIAGSIIGDEPFSTAVKNSRTRTVFELYKATADRNEFRKRWYAEIWDHYALDGIIAPVQASPAVPHDGATELSPMASATVVFNIVDSPVGVVPVTRVDPAKDSLTDEWANGPGGGSKLLESALYKRKVPVYNPEAMNGLPVGVQIAGKSWEDEKVIAMMRVVDNALGPRSFGPEAWPKEKSKL